VSGLRGAAGLWPVPVLPAQGVPSCTWWLLMGFFFFSKKEDI